MPRITKVGGGTAACCEKSHFCAQRLGLCNQLLSWRPSRDKARLQGDPG